MSGVVRFDCYEVDLDGGQLYKHGVRISLRDKSFQALALLLQHPGQVVTREELRRRLWTDEVFVDFDNNLNSAIGRLREALGDSADNPRFIETLPKHGYRFLADVSESLSGPKHSRTRRARLVVLPFLNLSGDPAQEYLGDAVADEITTDLASQAPEQLAVIARTTAMHYRGRDKNVSDIGRELGVDYVVEGGVHHVRDQFTINVQLIQVSDQTHLFARKYSAEQRDIFRAMDRAASDIAERVGITSAQGSNHAVAIVRGDRGRLTGDLAVYADYIQACQFLAKLSAEGFAKAKSLLG